MYHKNKQKEEYERFLTTRPLWANFEKGMYGIPVMWKPTLTIEKASYADILNYRNLSAKAPLSNTIISNFAFDSSLETVWRNPFSYLPRLRESLAVTTPDFSITPAMNEAQIINNTFRNRWMGCFWQQNYIDAIPTVSWAEKWTYSICIQGITKGSPFAVSTIGVSDIAMFLDGYLFFLNQIQPPFIICYGKPIPGMTGEIIAFDYSEAFMPAKIGQQERLFIPSRLIDDKKEEN